MWLFKQIRQEPVLFQALLQSFFLVLIAFGNLKLQDNQVTALYAVSAAFLSFITRTQVTPISNPRDAHGNQLTRKHNGGV